MRAGEETKHNPCGADCVDYTLNKHYHFKCMVCGNVFDDDTDEIKGIDAYILDKHGMIFPNYDILFNEIRKDCQNKEKEQ